MSLEIITLISVLSTLGFSIANLVLEIFRERNRKKLDQQRLVIDQATSGLGMIRELINMFKLDIKNPEKLKKQVEDIVKKYNDLKPKTNE